VDEAGMGKTIEAGLIMKYLKLRGEISRILVIVPKKALCIVNKIIVNNPLNVWLLDNRTAI
jgi:SNF2 family DNA or RNA helicase